MLLIYRREILCLGAMKLVSDLSLAVAEFQGKSTWFQSTDQYNDQHRDQFVTSANQTRKLVLDCEGELSR